MSMSDVPRNMFVKDIPPDLMKRMIALKEKLLAKSWKAFFWIVVTELENNIKMKVS